LKRATFYVFILENQEGWRQRWTAWKTTERWLVVTDFLYSFYFLIISINYVC